MLDSLSSLSESVVHGVARWAWRNWKGLVAAAAAAYIVNRAVVASRQSRLVRSRVAKYRARVEERTRLLEKTLREGLQEEERSLLTKERKEIVDLPLRSLLLRLKKGEHKPRQVLRAYQARALEATAATNCVTEFILEASKWAEELESTPEEERGPLHGLPISIKECLHIKDYPSTVGVSRFLDHPESSDGAVVAFLRSLGAVPFCKTNVGQLMKAPYCSNPIFGTTTHPDDDARTPGGSTGGEGALLALGGSPLGVGTDIAGSVRVPAAFCGVAALKPTMGRLCQRGRRVGIKGRVLGVVSNVGLMCPTADGLAAAYRIVLERPREAADRDHEVVPLPWNEMLFLRSRRPLRIGWYDTDGICDVTPGCKRAVREAAKLLEAAGHETLPFTPPLLLETAEFLFYNILADGAGANSLAVMEGEVWDETLSLHQMIWRTPWTLKRLLLRRLLSLTGDGIVAKFQDYSRVPHSTKDLWISLEKQHELIQEVLDTWQQNGIDMVLAPVFPCPAATLDLAAKTVIGVSITGIYNLLDFPAGSVRVTEESEEDQKDLEGFREDDNFYRAIKASTRGALGLPLGVQVIGKPWQEELVLGVMREIENRRDDHNYHIVY